MGDEVFDRLTLLADDADTSRSRLLEQLVGQEHEAYERLSLNRQSWTSRVCQREISWVYRAGSPDKPAERFAANYPGSGVRCSGTEKTNRG